MSRNDGEQIARTYANKFLETLREVVQESSLQERRLPRWLESANVRTAYVYNTLLLIAESNGSGDSFEHTGEVESDVEFLLEMPDYPGYSTDFRTNRQVRERGEFYGGNIIDSITFKSRIGSHLIGFGYDYHLPIIVLDAQLELTDKNETPIANRYIPFALYVHMDELVEPSGHFKNLHERVVESLTRIHNSSKGDEYKEERVREEAILGRKSDSVVVLGSYDGEEKTKLREVRDFLATKEYNANLIDQLPGHKDMDLRDKVRAWTSTARFCIMVDSEPSGHNNEYEILREQETILAVLRPKDSGSSFMMGPDVERNTRRAVFEYESTPLEVLEQATEWAESLITSEDFTEYYPWRN